jgi:predicted nucleic acid-binding protein
VVVAAFAPWHEHHERAAAAIRDVGGLIAHVELETYSVLTRMPPPRRAPAPLVGTFLRERFPGERLELPTSERRGLIDRLAFAGIAGGAVYDALIAACAAAHGVALVTLDERALSVYELFDVPLLTP